MNTKFLIFTLFIITISAYYEQDLNKALVEKVCEGCDLTKIELKDGKLTIDDAKLPFLKFLNVHYGTDLKGARFAYSNLNGSNLVGMDLSGSDLRYTNLSGLYFDKANLEEADLRHAKSGGTDYIMTNLKNTHLENANLSGSLLVDAKNIETAFCNNNTLLPLGYSCVNGRVSIGNCDESPVVPLGYYCQKGKKKPQRLPFTEKDLDEFDSPQEFYGFFEDLKAKFQN